MRNTMYETRNARKLFFVFAAAVLTAVSAMAAGISGSVYTAGVSQYLWRGQVLSGGFAVQPGVTLNLGKFSIGYCASAHEYASPFQLNESDYTVSFTDTAPYLDFLSLTAGFTAYTFPYGPAGQRTSVEVFAGASAAVPSNPYLKYYYDAQLGNGGYIEAGISHSIALGDFSVSGAAVCGYNAGQWAYSPSLTVAGLTLAGSYAIAGFKISPSVFCQLPLDSQYETKFFGSLGINYDFTL